MQASCRAFIISALSLIVAQSSLAQEKKRFYEFPSGSSTFTFDVDTMKLIQPGRFTIISTNIGDPDTIKFELNALDTLKEYCSKSSGEYVAPEKLFTSGAPDRPVKKISVSTEKSVKTVIWQSPYEKFRSSFPMINCSRSDWYMKARAAIANGVRAKYLFDCKRGMTGIFVDVDDPPGEAITHFVIDDTYGALHYVVLCYAITREPAFPPEKRGT
jgi:hypothetical protein